MQVKISVYDESLAQMTYVLKKLEKRIIEFSGIWINSRVINAIFNSEIEIIFIRSHIETLVLRNCVRINN